MISHRTILRRGVEISDARGRLEHARLLVGLLRATSQTSTPSQSTKVNHSILPSLSHPATTLGSYMVVEQQINWRYIRTIVLARAEKMFND